MIAKSVLFLLLCVSQTTSPAAEYFVAPTGDDASAGTLAAPFATVQRAQQAVAPGDTVWLRGGDYRPTESQITRRERGQAHVIVLAKSGTEPAPIRYWAYRDEKPIFDFSAVKPADLRVTACFVSGSWLHLKGLTFTGVQVTILGHTQSICFANEGDHNVYEQLTMRDGQAIGFWLGRGSHNLVLNCDAFQNHDYTSENKLGGNVDGFGFHVPKGSVGNVFRGCRAWCNSDDGFDFINTAESVTAENCWAFYNGFDAKFQSLGDGNGFKAGGYARALPPKLPTPIPRHLVRQCLAVRNKASGFYANHQPGGNDWLNNSAYGNRVNFNLLGRQLDAVDDLPGYGHKMRNNLGFKGKTELANLNAEASDVAGNYFNLPIEITKDDFAGLDEADLIKPRQPNGDLPVIAFMHLAQGSKLIDRGTDLGLPFSGQAPDLGAFEFTEKAASAR
jgi:hypothetical protein